MNRSALPTLPRPLVSVLITFLMLTAPALAASAEDDLRERWRRASRQNLVEALEHDGRFTLLLAALDAAGLTETVATAHLTVFAPTDEAFLALGEETIEALLADVPTLTDILLYHVVDGRRILRSLAREGQVETLQGGTVLVERAGRRFYVNGTTIVGRGIPSTNGKAYVIEEVLSPGDTVEPIESVVDVLARDGRFGILLEAATAAGLAETLATADPVTVFAPTDEAFLALGEETIAGLLEDLDLLREILLYHVLLEDKPAFLLVIEGTAETAQGSPVRVDLRSFRGLFVDDARVIEADQRAPNGRIHVIDSVLLPPPADETVLDALENEGFTTLANLIREAGLAEALQDLGPVTIFAPTNEAFAALGEETLAALLADIPTLQQILLYHVVLGQKSALEVVLERNLTTVEGSNLRSRWFFGPVFVGPHRVVAPNLTAPDAVVHGIDGVLIPPSS